MAFWNRNKKNDLANEFREYYQPNTNERTGLAWLLALITLVCSVFLIVSLFWGGRWIYRKVANNDNKPAVTQPTTRGTVSPTPAPSLAPTSGEAPTPTPTPTPQSGVAGTSATPTPTPASSNRLPSTGPDIDL